MRGTIAVKATIVLSLLLAVTTANIGVIYYYQRRTAYDAHTINVSGRQRMLSQTITRLALSVNNGRNTDRERLAESVQDYDAALKALWYGGEIMGKYVPPASELRGVFQRNSSIWKPFKEKAEIVIKESRDNIAFKESIDYIQRHTDNLLGISAFVTQTFSDIFSRKIAFLRVLFLILLGMDILFFIAGYVMAIRIVRPLRDISMVAVKVGAGDFTARAQVVSKDEIGDLAISFNKMTVNLQKTTVSRDYVDSIITSMIDMLIVMSPEANIKTVNQAVLDLLGYKEEELIGKPIATLFAEETFTLRGLKELKKSGAIIQHETDLRTKGGERIPVRLSCSVIRDKKDNILNIVCVARDITEQKKAEGRLRLQSGALEAAANPIIITNTEGIIEWVNPAFTAVTGYTSKEVVGENPRLLKSSEHDDGFYRELWQTIKSGKIWRGELTNRRKDGTFYVEEQTITPVKNEEGELVHFIAVKQDITERKKSEKESAENASRLKSAHLATLNIMQDLKEEKEVAIQLGKEAQAAAKAKSNFLANMSHEIRTPMNAILGFSALLKKTSVDERQTRYLDTITSSGDLLISIIDDILDISKLESGKVILESVNFNLEDLLHDVFNMIVARMADKPFDTYVDIDANVPVNIIGDPTRLKQVLVNLLGNAVKFTSKGSIGISVHRTPPSKEEPGDSEDVELLFSVKDTGIGISSDKFDIIFETFTQTDESTTRQFGGTGLGLAISKSLIEAMGGRIWVESEVGKGTEFKFIAKLKVGKSVDDKKMDRASQRVLAGKKVFIVDDNKIARKIINKCCDGIGLETFGEADSPQSALNKLDKLASNRGIIPDLILCDIMMEGMTGFELVKKIRANKEYANTRFIAVTADLHVEASKEAASEVFDAYITKPVNIKEMIRVIANVVKEKEEGKREEKEEEVSCKGIKVLVAEDIDTNQMLIQVYFEELGCEGDCVHNGQEAIDKLKEDNDYDLCLMDLQMPIMSGLEATKIIRREISKELPIIALTADVMKEDRERTDNAGMNDFLCKPIDIDKLRKIILKYGKS